MYIGERLRALRKERGWKLREVSKKTGLSVSYISDLERGRQSPSLKTFQKFVRLYGMTLSEMFIDVTLAG